MLGRLVTINVHAAHYGIWCARHIRACCRFMIVNLTTTQGISYYIILFLANIDAREQLVLRAGHYFIERAFGTDDLENFFSEVCRRSRSGRQAPNCQTAMLVARTAERVAKLLWDGRWRKYESKRKRYTRRPSARHMWIGTVGRGCRCGGESTCQRRSKR